MFGGFVSAYFHFVQSKVVTRCVVEWGHERFQAGSGQVSHELSFSFCFKLSAEYASEFHRLGQIMTCYDPRLCSDLCHCSCHPCVSDLMKVSSYQQRYPMVSGEHNRVFDFKRTQSFIYSTTNSDDSIFVCKWT